MRLICLVLMVSASGFYNWMKCSQDKPNPRRAQLKVDILTLHSKSRETYGLERIHATLRQSGVSAGLWTVKKLRQEIGLRCRQKRHIRVHGNTTEQLPPSDNILDRQFRTDKVNKVWFSDITYIRTRGGWLYFAGIKDACSKEIVGYSLRKAKKSRKQEVSALLTGGFPIPPGGFGERDTRTGEPREKSGVFPCSFPGV